MRAGRALIHQRGGNAAAGLRECKQRPDLGGGAEWEGGGVCDGRAQGLRVVFDLVFLFVEFVLPEEVVDRLVVL